MNDTAVIFGGSGDLGHALTECLKKRGINVLSSYNKQKLEPRTGFFKYTSCGKDNVKIFETLNQYEIKYLVFCIGIRSSKQRIENTDISEFLDLVKVNAISFIEIYRSLKTNLTRNNAHIIVVGSSAFKENKATNGAYSASKAYLNSIVNTISNENTEIKIQVINPILFDSRLAHEIVKIKGYNDFNKYVDEILGGMIKTSKDVAFEIENLLFSDCEEII